MYVFMLDYLNLITYLNFIADFGSCSNIPSY